MQGEHKEKGIHGKLPLEMIMFYGELPLDTCHATRFIPSGSTMLWNAHVNYDETRFCAIPPTLPLRPILTFFIFDFHLPLPLG